MRTDFSDGLWPRLIADIGGMVGAGLMSGTVVYWWGIMSHVVIPMFASPIISFNKKSW